MRSFSGSNRGDGPLFPVIMFHFRLYCSEGNPCMLYEYEQVGTYLHVALHVSSRILLCRVHENECAWFTYRHGQGSRGFRSALWCILFRRVVGDSGRSCRC